jgi:hypothetical protein
VVRSLFIASLVMCVAVFAGAHPSTSAESVARARQYVLSRLDAETGRCLDEYDESDPRYGGMTALCVYALLEAGCDYQKIPVLKQAVRWLAGAKLHGTEAVSLRAAALASLKDERVLKNLQRDVDWLLQAAYRDGSYTDVSANGKDRRPDDPFDNTNSQWAVLGVYAGVERGLSVPGKHAYWGRVTRYWQSQQQPDGGWGYGTQLRGGKMQDKPYGSITAAGVATLSICRYQAARGRHVEGHVNPPIRPLQKGLAWLENNISVDANPRKNAEWYYAWLFHLQRVGELTGRRYIAGVNWNKEATKRLRRKQNPDGSWGYGPRTTQTCFALLFLARGEAPILLNKLQYDGPWDVHARDAANLTGWLTYMFERPLGWQVLDMTAATDKNDAGWRDGRIAQLSITGPMNLSEEQIDRLRQFVRRGGLIFTEALGGKEEHTRDVQRLAVRLFPEYPLAPLDAKHPIYNLQFTDVAPRDLQVVHNGVRPLLIHSPHDVSLALQLGAKEKRRPTFNLMANLYLYLTEKGAFPPRGRAHWPAPTKRKPTRTICLARVKHAGNCDPEPAAMQRLALELAQYDADLKVSAPLSWDHIDAKQYPVACMTGTASFDLSSKERRNLEAYLQAGGTLLADAAGGSNAFADSFRREVFKPLGQANPLPADSKLLTGGPKPLDRFQYRKAATPRGSKESQSAPRLEAVYLKNRPVVIFSPDDVTAGLVGYPLQGLKGLTPDTARAMMTSLVLQLSKRAETPADQ